MVTMQISFDHLLARAKAWAERATAENWLAPRDIQPLLELEHRTPAALFDAGIHRPLVAAFFGGTGVGKSTLLNRLAGRPIARTGIERPTSREISIYLHESVKLRNFPDGFPADRVRMAFHDNDARREILWIDMPDIDSVEQDNRELVLEWLPHIDVLIYVVSPERYRDDKGWRLLKAHGCQHAWLFVINQWDRGREAQYEDFSKLLGKAEFRDPIVLRTDSRDIDDTRKADDFERLQDLLRDMADRHVMSQLETRAEAARIAALNAALHAALDKLGNGQGYQGLQAVWSELWREIGGDLLQGLEWPIQTVARAFVGHEASPLLKKIDLTRSPPPETAAAKPVSPSLLWDEWAQNRFKDALDRLVVEAGGRELSALPLKAEMDRLAGDANRSILAEGQRSLRQALANPGNALQRILLKISGLMAVLLPLAAIGWVSWQVVRGYYRSALLHTDYLGTDFAVHSGLLIAIAWLLPYFIYRKLKPSAERTAVKGLRAGIELGLNQAGERVSEALEKLEQRRRSVLEEGRDILALSAAVAAPQEAGRGSGLLERVLPRKKMEA
jgi:hypothetical protein